jgi:hypothetical protein
MKCSVMQMGFAPPSVQQLAEAFKAVPTLAPQDAFFALKLGGGFLAKGLPAQAGADLVAALAAQGVEARSVDEAALPQMPSLKKLNRAECVEPGLIVYDALGRQKLVDWPRVRLIAAGQVTLMDHKRVEEQYPIDTSAPLAITAITYKEDPHSRLLLEVITDDARYQVQGHNFNYGYLGDRLQQGSWPNFMLLVRDLVEHTNAILSRGAAALQQEPAQIVRYPHLHVFEQEIVWLLWYGTVVQAPSEPAEIKE